MSHISDRADRFVQKLLKKPPIAAEEPKDPSQQQKVFQRLKSQRQRMLKIRERM